MFTFIRPEFFDIFGVFVFGLITYQSSKALYRVQNFPQWMTYFLLFVGIAGLIIDGTIVYKTYIKK
jgi:Co/Zn/Cd efflux system component